MLLFAETTYITHTYPYTKNKMIACLSQDGNPNDICLITTDSNKNIFQPEPVRMMGRLLVEAARTMLSGKAKPKLLTFTNEVFSLRQK